MEPLFIGVAVGAASVRQDRTIEPNKMHQTFHEAKYPVYLQMYQDQQQYQVLMNSWLTLND